MLCDEKSSFLSSLLRNTAKYNFQWQELKQSVGIISSNKKLPESSMYSSKFFLGWNLFRNLHYHLGLKASLGVWKVCATTNPWVQRTSVHRKSTDEYLINCWNFTVISKEIEQDAPEDGIDGETILRSATLTASEEVKSEPHFVTLSFGNEFQSSYQRNIPISGRVWWISALFFVKKRNFLQMAAKMST